MHNQDLYICSDELRELTKSGGSWHQIHQLKRLRIAYSLDAYGTPVVKRVDFDKFRRFNPWNFSCQILLDLLLSGDSAQLFLLRPRSVVLYEHEFGLKLTSNAASIARWSLVALSIWHQSSLVFLAGLLHPPPDGLFVFLKLPRAMFSVRAPNRNQKKRVTANATNPKDRSGQTEMALSTWRSPLQSYFGQLANSAKRSSL